MSVEDQVLSAARAGDRDALGALLAEHQARVLRFGLKMCRTSDEASDVLQDTLLAAARTIGGFRGDSSVSTWLYTIARSFCLKKRRRRKAEPDYVASLDTDANAEAMNVPDPGRDPERAAMSSELAEALDAAIRMLEPDQREVLLLRDVEGLTAPEVAKVVGASVAAVKSRLHRARAELRVLLEPILEPVITPATGTCPDIVSLYSRNREDEIDADLCDRMQAHIDECPRCKETCDGLKTVLSACSAVPLPHVPAKIQEAVRRAVQMPASPGT